MTTDKPGIGMAKPVLMLLIATACIVYGIYLIQAIYVDRALYADGANFFVELLTKTSRWPVADDSKHIRLFVNIINQLPFTIALKSGVTNLETLRMFFGAGLFLSPLFFYLYCFYLSRRANDFRVFYFSLVCLVTCAIPSDMFVVNQAFTSLAISWVVIHYLLLDLKIKWFDWLVFLFISALLFRSHESLIMWGGIFFIGAAAVLFFRERCVITNKNLMVYTFGIVGLLQSAFVAFWQYSHPVDQQTSAFLQLLVLLKPGELWIGNTRISLLMTAALLLVFVMEILFYRALSGWKLLKFFAVIAFVFILGWMLETGASPLSNFTLTDPAREFEYRFLLAFGSSGWMLLTIAFILFGKNISNRTNSLNKIIVCVGIISASLWQISNNLQWSLFSDAASQVLLSSSSSTIAPDNVRQKLAATDNENAYKYRWGWTWPVFGMSIQNEWEIKKLYKPEGYEEYFSPPKHIPFIPMGGGEIGSKGPGLYRFDQFLTSTKRNL